MPLIMISNNVRYTNIIMIGKMEMLNSAPAGARDADRLNRLQVVTVLLCSLVLFVDGYDTQVISYAAPILAKEWHLSHAMLGYIFSAGFGGGMIGYMVLAPLSDFMGHKKAVVASVLAFGLLTLLTVLATSVTELIVIRLLTGMALGVTAPSVVALVGEYSPTRMRATLVLIVYCGFSLGFIAAGAVAAPMLRSHGWPSLFWVGAIAPLVLVPLLGWLLPESQEFLSRKHNAARTSQPRQNAGGATEKPYIRNNKVPVVALLREGRARGTIVIWAIFFFNAGSFYLLQSWLPTLLTAAGRPLDAVAFATSMTTVGGIAAAFLIGPLMDRIGHARALTTVYLFGVFSVCLLAFTLSAPLMLLLLAAFLSGACVSGGQKSIIALTALYYPVTLRGSGVGFALGVGRLGAMIGPLIAGTLLSIGVPQYLLMVSIAALLLISSVLTLLLGTERQLQIIGQQQESFRSAS